MNKKQALNVAKKGDWNKYCVCGRRKEQAVRSLCDTCLEYFERVRRESYND